jgi:hypothetical protein
MTRSPNQLPDHDPAKPRTRDATPDDDDPRAALGRLGALVRDHASPPARPDLAARVLARVRDGAAADDGALIDDFYNGATSAAAADPGLARLRRHVRAAATPPKPVHLLPRVEARLRRQAAASSRSRTVSFDAGRRWKLWTTVAAAHAAALVAAASLTFGHAPRHGTAMAGASDRSYRLDLSIWQDRVARRLDVVPVTRWSQLVAQPADLLALRRDAARRSAARAAYRMDDSARSANALLAGLVSEPRSDGRLGPEAPTPTAELAVQSLTALALLGEGLDDPVRDAAARALLGWLAGAVLGPAADDPRSSALAACALIEGHLLTGDATLAEAARVALHRLAATPRLSPGEAGIGGFAILAVETARVAGLAIPDGLLAQVRREVAVAQPRHADLGRRSLAVFARRISGATTDPTGPALLAELGSANPLAPGAQRDPLGAFFAGLALRELGGPAWLHWSEIQQHDLLSVIRFADDGSARIPAEAVRHASAAGPAGDRYASALALLVLQLPYRYLPTSLPP